MEGEVLRQFQHTLKLNNNGKLFALFPLTVCHIIDSTSPLYDLSAKDLLEKKYMHHENEHKSYHHSKFN